MTMYIGGEFEQDQGLEFSVMREALKKSINEFEEQCGIPQIVGAVLVDGCQAVVYIARI